MEYTITLLTNEIIENYSGLFETLKHLTSAPELSKERTKELIKKMRLQNIFVYVALFEEKKEIIGAASILVEQKLIHGGKKVGHIEDVSTNKKYIGKGIGRELIKRCVEKGREENCYKIILDCEEKLVPFYEKLEFHCEGSYMRLNL